MGNNRLCRGTFYNLPAIAAEFSRAFLSLLVKYDGTEMTQSFTGICIAVEAMSLSFVSNIAKHCSGENLCSSFK